MRIHTATTITATAVLTMLAAFAPMMVAPAAAGPAITFTHVVVDSFPPRNQHAKTVGDIDGDGYDDIVTSSAVVGDGMYWYHYPSWTRYPIVPANVASFGTDMQLGDVDNDGDLDVVVPQRLEKTVWWYENPRPGGDPTVDPWGEHFIGATSGHDLELADIDLDGRLDVVVREDSTFVFVQDGLGGWTAARISTRPDEGVALGDIDDDGDVDVAINGYWLENPMPLGDPLIDPWSEHLIDSNWPTQVGVHIADINNDARLDVVLAPSESASGRLSWYDAPAGPYGAWVETVIDADISYVHTFKSADMDGDGDLDLVTAEMEQSDDPDEVSVYFNFDGGQTWAQQVVAVTGSHNIRVADIGRDGDMDIVGANWNGQQVLDLWRNDLDPALDLDSWQRHVVDPARPWRSVFVTAADLDEDGLDDIVTGGWWYRNPGAAGGAWVRDSLGTGLGNMACVFDADNDGDPDVLGTRGQGAQANDSLVWVRNDGAGFTILDNIENADGDFLQGVAVVPRLDGGSEVMLSWHDTTTTLQRLTVPGDPSLSPWVWSDLALPSQNEALSAGDIDRDGDVDLLQGTTWLRNDSTAWTAFPVTASTDPPDRNRLADINRDGRLDAVVGYEAVSASGTLAWYEQGPVATDPWTEHVIATVVGPMSVGAADMDGDGDVDVVVGEHNLSAPETAGLYVYENADGAGNSWVAHTVYVGDEHHDGACVVDIDRDGDMDIVSIGWGHGRVLLYENRALTSGGGGLVNYAPLASLTAAPTSGLAPVTVSFDASLSFDPNNDPLTFTWDFGDGSPPDTGAVATHIYTQPGIFAATVTVSDGELTDVAGATITATAIAGPGAGLVHHWRFDEGDGTTAGDSAGTADGTLSGGASWSEGRTGGGVRFDGVDDSIDIGAVDVVSDSGLTLALWFRADDFDVHDARLITKATGTATADHFWMLSTINQTALRFRLRAGGTTDLLLTDTGVIDAGRWHHVAATYDGATMRIYRDGEEVASMPKTGIVDTDSTVLAAIGDQPAGAGNLPFDGIIDDVRIYNRALAPAEIDSLVTYRLTTAIVGEGALSIAPSPPDYPAGDTVVVEAVPAANWSFAGWSGSLSGIENPDTLVMTGDAGVTATFVHTHFTLTRQALGGGVILAAPDSTAYAAGDTVVVTAVADSGWLFDHWQGLLTGGASPDTLVMPGADTTLTAQFRQIATVRTTVTGGGNVLLSPDSTLYLVGDTVVVTAVPDSAWSFVGWSGDLTGAANPDTLVLAADTTAITATFAQTTYSLDITTEGQGMVMRVPDLSAYVAGDTVVVTAVPDSAWSFGGWSGDVSGELNPDTLVVDSSMVFTAVFEPTPTAVTGTRAPAFLTLMQNYPNPFGRDTGIRFGLPAAGTASFEVFNVRGQRVYHRTLHRPAGWHELRFPGGDSGDLPAGVYFYRLRMQGQSAVRKMVIVR